MYIIKLYFIGRITFKCHQKGQNLENKKVGSVYVATTTQNSAEIFGPLEVV